MSPLDPAAPFMRALGHSIACIGYVMRDLCARSPLSPAAWEQVRHDAALAVERFADAVAAVTGEPTPLADAESAEIAELEQLYAIATPGPWCEHPNGTSIWSGAEYDNNDPNQKMLLAVLVDRIQTDAKGAYDDVALVVALHNMAPRVLADARLFRRAARERWGVLKLPRLPEAEAHERARQQIRAMSPKQQFETLVKAGIYNPDGTLAEAYGGPKKT